MTTRWSIIFLLFAPLARAGETPATAIATPPATNWVLPIFTDAEGYRSMTLRGSEVRATNDKAIAVTNLNITIFSGDAAARVDSILLSPRATFLPKENRATGDSTMRFIRDDVEVTGIGWTYDHNTKKVSLAQNVRVVFHARLNDILK
jgi:lipopolysaccharide export system protein LptC